MSENQRRARHEELLASTAALLEHAPDEEARLVYEFIIKNGVLAEPYESEIRSMDPIDTPDWFLILHVLPGDEINYPGMAQLPKAGAAYFEWEMRLMVFRRPDPYTSGWRSILLLHEGRHARSILMHGEKSSEPLGYEREERDTHALQHRVVSRFAGRKYREFIDAQAKWVRKKLLKDGRTPGIDFIVPLIPPTVLDSSFGPALSVAERNSRIVHTILHIGFRVIETCWKGKVAEQQALFYRSYMTMLHEHQAKESGQ